MNLPNKQQALIDFARANGDQITTKQAVQVLDGYYYTNAAHYVSEILKRMVTSGKLKRTKIGHYELGTRQSSSDVVAVNQIGLF